MNGLVIVNQELGHNGYKIKRLREEFAKLDVTLDVFVNDGTLAMIKDNNIEINLPKADFVIYLDKDCYLAKELEKSGYRLFNKADFIKLCDDKNFTNIACANHGIKMPRTIAGPLFYSEKIEENNLTFLDKVIEELGLPLVFKKVYGSLGMGVHLVSSKEELRKLYIENCKEAVQFQEYIKSSYGTSIRVIIIDQKVVGGYIRFNEGDFRSNFGKNSSSKKLDNSNKYYDFAQKIADIFKIEYAGIDILLGNTKEPILCEINSNAFFEEFEKITQINVAEKFAKMIVEKTLNEQK